MPFPESHPDDSDRRLRWDTDRSERETQGASGKMSIGNEARADVPYPRRIVSGGQTGVDRAALDVAIELGIPHGGWCPKGRRAEDGPIPAIYRLTETEDVEYAERTVRNINDSDATLLLIQRELQGGSLLTYRTCIKLGKPVLVVRLHRPGPDQRFWDWMRDHRVWELNVAGPRASKEPEVYRMAKRYLLRVFGEPQRAISD